MPDQTANDLPREHTSLGILTLIQPDGSRTRYPVDLPHVAGSSPGLAIGDALSEDES
jgi:hypothetical protein